MKEKKHIDDYIFSKLDNTELNGERIGWDKFIERRRKKRRTILFVRSFSGLALLILGILVSRMVCNEKDFHRISIKNHVNNLKSFRKTYNSAEKNQFYDNKPEKLSGEKREKTNKKIGSISIEENSIEETDLLVDSTEMPLTVLPLIYPVEINSIDIVSKKVHFKYNYFLLPELKTPNSEIKNKRKLNEYWFAGFETGLFISDINPVIPSADKAWFHKDYSRIRNEAERNFLGQTLGISFGRRFKNFSVFSGLSYNRVSGTGHYNFVYKEAPLLNPDNSIFGYSELSAADQETISFQSSQTYTSFGVPIGLGIKIKEKGRNYFGISASYQANWLLNVSGIVPQSVFIYKTSNLNKTGIKLNSSIISLGLNYQYKINSRYLFELNPYFKRSKMENKQDHSGGIAFQWYGLNGKLIWRF